MKNKNKVIKDLKLRDRDILTIRITDWSDDNLQDEPAIDVEIYINGEYQFDESKVFSINPKNNKFQALEQARKFAISFVKSEKLSV